MFFCLFGFKCIQNPSLSVLNDKIQQISININDKTFGKNKLLKRFNSKNNQIKQSNLFLNSKTEAPPLTQKTLDTLPDISKNYKSVNEKIGNE